MRIIELSVMEEKEPVLGALRKSGIVEVKIRFLANSDTDTPPDTRSVKAMTSWVATQLLYGDE
jgi:hypothetical protein